MVYLLLEKASFKFAVAHFTLLSSARAERLHGHNYQVIVRLCFSKADADLGMVAAFKEVKGILQKICDGLDEYILIPKASKLLKVVLKDKRVKVWFRKKYYDFPAEDVRLLPVVNITCEAMAEYIADVMSKKCTKFKNAISLLVEVRETVGQGAAFEKEIQ